MNFVNSTAIFAIFVIFILRQTSQQQQQPNEPNYEYSNRRLIDMDLKRLGTQVDENLKALVASSTINNENAWNYLVNKYSFSKSYFTPNEIEDMVKNLQKCDKLDKIRNNIQHAESEDFKLNKNPNLNTKNNNFQPPTSSIVINSCNITTNFAQSTTFNSINGLGHFSQICPQILYIIDNQDCCTNVNPNFDSSSPYLKAAVHFSSSENQNHLIRDEIVQSREDTPDSILLNHKEDEGEELTFAQVASDSEANKKPTTGEVWGYGVLFVTIISASSVVGVSVMPLMGKKLYKYILTTMIGLAVGSLTGSSVFHLMPRAFNLSQNDPCHDYLFTSLVVCAGIWMFFMVERILKLIMDYKDRKDNPSWGRVKESHTLSNTPENSTISMLVDNNSHSRHGSGEHNTSMCSHRGTELIYESQEQAIKASFGHQEKPKVKGHDHMVKFEQGKDSVIATVAWMIIFGDGLHNFIDGLSIGAAFNESILAGVSISVAVLCEELPHELGDFAVLLNAGMSMRQAVLYNFLSACTCYLGMAVGIFLGEVEASSYIFGLASGMFLYIALVDMVPEMNEVAEASSKQSVKRGLFILLLQNIGIFIGIIALFILAKYQDNIKF